jgi:hypothetical protein
LKGSGGDNPGLTAPERGDDFSGVEFANVTVGDLAFQEAEGG